jgi:hypothetical protein
MEQNKLTNLLKSKTNGAGAVQAAPAAAIGAEHAFAPGGAHHGVLPERSPGGVGVAPPPAGPAAAASKNKLLAKLNAAGAPAAEVVPAAINPPEYQPPPQAAPAAQAGPAAAVHASPATPPAPLPATTQQASQELAASLQAGEAAAGDKRGRGRPAKAALPATGLSVKIKTLYINCGPVGVVVADGAQLIALAKKSILASTGLTDYRFAEYGQGPGMLAVAAMAELDALEGVVAALRLDTDTPEGTILAAELMARAELVVR